MKRLLYLLAALAVLVCLPGCKSKKAVIQESQTIQLTDTTKLRTDSTATTELRTDSTDVTAQESTASLVEFVDGGGTVTIDSAGRISLQGVKNIKAGKLSSWHAIKRTEAAKQSDSVTTQQANGIKRDEATQRKEKTKVSTKPAWYNTMPVIIVFTICLAVILWLLFNYIKRKL